VRCRAADQLLWNCSQHDGKARLELAVPTGNRFRGVGGLCRGPRKWHVGGAQDSHG
jgi:hypothetical protein